MSLIRNLTVDTNNSLTYLTVSEVVPFFAYTALATVFECKDAPVVCVKCVSPLRITVFEKQMNSTGIINTLSIIVNSYNRIMGEQ